MIYADSIKNQVSKFCVQIGNDPLLVQGAGGNISWKDGGALWIKASGTWLADAQKKDIFLPVDLCHLQESIEAGNFKIKPKVLVQSALRPSIETLLHVLMPHKIVVHLHAIEALAHLVRAKPHETIAKAIGNGVNWICIDYYTPGEQLAAGMAAQLKTKSNTDVVFLCNHGIVIGASTITELNDKLQKIVSTLRCTTLPIVDTDSEDRSPFIVGTQIYLPCGDSALHQLAINPSLLQRLEQNWVLYPDHAVFLGGQAVIIEQSESLANFKTLDLEWPAFIFISEVGVFENSTVTLAQKAQLRCYYDVLVRQSSTEHLVSLSRASVGKLLNWDAEQYRQAVNK